MKKFTRVFALALVCVMALALLVACAPNKDYKKATASLKDKGYVVLGGDDALSCSVVEKLVDGSRGDVVAAISASAKDDNGAQVVSVWYFKDAATANKAWKKAQESAESEKDKDSSDWTVAKSGSIIYFGTSAAIKAAR